MNKQEFLAQLRNGLSGLPKEDVDERLSFIGEMIDDRMEEGVAEEAAVKEIGSVDALVSQIIAEIPLGKLVKEKIAPKRKLKAWEIVLLALGSPIWLSLLIAAAAVLLSAAAALWSGCAAAWAAFAALAVCGPAGMAAGGYFAAAGSVPAGLAAIAAGITGAGIAVFLFFACRAATKGLVSLTGKFALWTKNCFIKKEVAQ